MYFPDFKFENLSHKTNSTTLSLGKLGSTDTKKDGKTTERTGILWCWLRLFSCCANFLYIEMKQLFVLAHLVVIVIDVNNLLTMLENWNIYTVYAVPWKL